MSYMSQRRGNSFPRTFFLKGYDAMRTGALVEGRVHSLASTQDIALAVLRIAFGIFFIFEGLGHRDWLTAPTGLTTILTNWLNIANPINGWYLQHVAIPGAPLFAWMVVIGEVAAGVAFLTGMWTRLAASAAFLMVFNFHFAHGRIFHFDFLTQSNGLPVLAALIALAIAEDRGVWSLKLSRGKSS